MKIHFFLAYDRKQDDRSLKISVARHTEEYFNKLKNLKEHFFIKTKIIMRSKQKKKHAPELIIK